MRIQIDHPSIQATSAVSRFRYSLDAFALSVDDTLSRRLGKCNVFSEDTNCRPPLPQEAPPDGVVGIAPIWFEMQHVLIRHRTARQGEVGRTGVAIDSVEDMERLFAGIPLAEVSTSMTINATARDPAAALRARRRGAGRAGRGPAPGTVQNDLLKEYAARGTYIYPPRPSMRLDHGPVRLLRRADPAAGTRSRSAATTCARPGRRRAGDRLHARRWDRVRAGGARRRARRRRRSRRGCRSSSRAT
mgnify:CR=1 FL=1